MRAQHTAPGARAARFTSPAATRDQRRFETRRARLVRRTRRRRAATFRRAVIRSDERACDARRSDHADRDVIDACGNSHRRDA